MSDSMPVYGGFPGGDPREFTPDMEVCTSEEVERWRLACDEWSQGKGVNLGPGCQTMGDSSTVMGTGFGLGTYYVEWEDEDEDEGEEG